MGPNERKRRESGGERVSVQERKEKKKKAEMKENPHRRMKERR